MLKKTRPKALIFIGFRHKKDTIKTAVDAGFKVILMTEEKTEEATQLFNEVIEGPLLDATFINKHIPAIKNQYAVKGIISNYEHYVVIRSYLAERFNVPSSTTYSAACTRNKAMQRHALAYMKENVDYRIIHNEKEALEAFSELGGNVFIKSIAGVKSAHVFHADSQDKLKNAMKILVQEEEKIDRTLYYDYAYCDFNFSYPDPKTTFLVEKAIKGRQVTVASLASNYTVWHAPSVCDVYSASHIGINDSFLAFRILPSNLPPAVVKKAKLVADGVIRVLGMRYSPVHTELIIAENGDIKIIETASRMGGYRSLMYNEAYGIDLSQLMVKSVIGKEIKTRKQPKKYVSMMEIFAREEGVFTGLNELEKLQNDAQVTRLEILAKKDHMVGPARLGYRPCLRFLIHGKTYKEVYNKSVDYQKNIQALLKNK